MVPPHFVQSRKLKNRPFQFIVRIWKDVTVELKQAIPTIPTAPSTGRPSIRHDVYLNRQTTLSTLHIYEDVDVWLEYPETQTDRPIGYLFDATLETGKILPTVVSHIHLVHPRVRQRGKMEAVRYSLGPTDNGSLIQ